MIERNTISRVAVDAEGTLEGTLLRQFLKMGARPVTRSRLAGSSCW